MPSFIERLGKTRVTASLAVSTALVVLILLSRFFNDKEAAPNLGACASFSPERIDYLANALAIPMIPITIPK